MLSKKDIQAAYQRQAKYYDFAVWLYRLIGIRMAYRLSAVKLLRLRKGDCVVELGCGTGLNFPFIIEQIGPEGRLIGVDIAPKMLEYARKRVDRFGWENVELVESDMAKYGFPKEVNGVLSTGVFGYIAEYDRVIKTVSDALVPGGRLVIMDGKRPEGWSLWFKFVLWLSRAFGVTLDYGDRRPWESVNRHFQETRFDRIYGGAMYISSGTAPSGARWQPINAA
jgi:demethylmenaquinone methyltransferase/2-methoxy-6-polyprenyl-1,4-benzoquinol methylase